MSKCKYGDRCVYAQEGFICNFWGHLHPKDDLQQMEHRSINKKCGVCMEIVLEKEPPIQRRFGILENCNHVFCFSCLQKWRCNRSKHFDNATIRACPECKIVSNYVIPSEYLVETKDEKEKLIRCYQKAISAKPCKYLKQGQGICPFAGACFYLHAYPDGTKVETPRSQNSHQNNRGGEWEDDEHDFFDVSDSFLASPVKVIRNLLHWMNLV